ncbi:MAG: hypothetical protein ACREMY_29095 [bacterium]
MHELQRGLETGRYDLDEVYARLEPVLYLVPGNMTRTREEEVRRLVNRAEIIRYTLPLERQKEAMATLLTDADEFFGRVSAGEEGSPGVAR